MITVGAISTALVSCWSAGFAIKHPSTPLFAVELVIDILFMVDVVLNFNTGGDPSPSPDNPDTCALN